MTEAIFANMAVKKSHFKVATSDLTKHPWDEKLNGTPTEYFSSFPNIHIGEIWAESVPPVPPGASTSVIEAAEYAVFLNIESVPDSFRSYVTVEMGGNVNSPPKGDFINPVVFGDVYRPKLYYYDGAAWVEVAYGGVNWMLDCGSGCIITTNGALPPTSTFPDTYWKLVGWRYVGKKLATVMQEAKVIGLVQLSDSSVIVTDVGDLKFDSSQFSLVDLGGGVAQVGLTAAATGFTIRDEFVPTAGQTNFTLSVATKVFAADMGLVFLNGVLARYGVDYVINNSTNPGSPTILIWGGLTLTTSDILEIRY